MTYDAAGRRYQSTQTTSKQILNPVLTTAVTKTEGYDGDGMLVKSARTTQVNNNAPATATTFFLRSSLTGNVITEYDSSGNRQNAYVFAGSELIAQQQRFYDGTTRLMWQHVNPVTGDGLSTDIQGVALEKTNVDPMGVNVGDTDPFISNEPTNGGNGEGMSQSAINAMVAALIPGFGGPTCKVDGMITGCRFAFGVVSSGAGAFVHPDTNTTSRMVIYQGKPVLATYRATDDGYQGYMPVTARYTGNGSFLPINPVPGPPTLQSNPIRDTNFAALNGVTGNSEGFLAPSLDDSPVLNSPTKLDAEGKDKHPSCSLSVSFQLGTSYGGDPNQANGPTVIKYRGGDFAGLGFTVTGSVAGGGSIEADFNPRGWALEQYVANYEVYNGTERPDPEFGTRGHLEGLSRAPHNIAGNSFSWWDHPGIHTERLSSYYRKINFAVKVIRGNQQCEVRFACRCRSIMATGRLDGEEVLFVEGVGDKHET